MTWDWIGVRVALAVHDSQIAEHGGLPGVKHEGLLESAIIRPQQMQAYGEPNLCDLAAAYGYGIVRNHPFNDANKRTAFILASMFIQLNGWCFRADKAESVLVMYRLATGELSEHGFSEWLEANSSN
jgi:death-on-curing protein